MKRIAQIGTFNVDNLGDLLFPVVFSEIVDEISKEINESFHIDYFSPNCINYEPTYSDQKPVIDIEEFKNIPYHKVFIGGGDLLRSDDWSINSIYNSNKLSFTNIISPTNLSISNCYTIGIGVPFELDEGFSTFVKNSFTRFNGISVRDKGSQVKLTDKGITSEIIPDMVLSISKYFPKKLLEVNMKEVFKRNKIELDDNQYIIFQANESVLNDIEIKGISNWLNGLSQKLKMPIILLSIGECLGDNELYYQLAPLLNDCYILDKERDSVLSLKDKVAILSQAQGFIGSSLHGNIISYSYGIPHVTFSGDYSNKLRGFFNLINMNSYCYKNSNDLLDKMDDVACYLSSKLDNYAALSVEINNIVRFVKNSLVEDIINDDVNLYSMHLDNVYKAQQLIINEKNNEISRLWKRVNAVEDKYTQTEEVNSTLWKRVNYSEKDLVDTSKQNEELWLRVNEAERNLKQANEDILKFTETVESIERENIQIKCKADALCEQVALLKKELEINSGISENLLVENIHLKSIEQEYLAVLASVRYYIKKKVKKGGRNN